MLTPREACRVAVGVGACGGECRGDWRRVRVGVRGGDARHCRGPVLEVRTAYGRAVGRVTAVNRRQLEAALASARATVASLEAALASAENKGASELLDVAAVRKQYGVGRDALKAAANRGELELSRGPRRRLLVKRDVLEAWLGSRPYEPPMAEPVADLEQWKAEAERRIAGDS